MVKNREKLKKASKKFNVYLYYKFFNVICIKLYICSKQFYFLYDQKKNLFLIIYMYYKQKHF